ncbi:hypothetical protein D1823_11785 [Ruegeria sp. AD91A]|uniref:hypothetical protein n=1 Tax=Ruegeria sp. AD91A TaxID=2293862 RepID=UPI000E4A7805|nr:hypothetical protein [Ruegeria sp. AD91A]AXT27198.1 hypothetical protein D1823_11785 [Ruegeria sp. AD91A]
MANSTATSVAAGKGRDLLIERAWGSMNAKPHSSRENQEWPLNPFDTAGQGSNAVEEPSAPGMRALWTSLVP